jgi:hypothetical protein
MLYAADIFLTPQQNIGKRAKGSRNKQASLNKLALIQRQAAIMITGAMKTTATDTLEVMVNLLPFHLLVDKHCYHVVICLTTPPSSHPLHKPVANTVNRLVKLHTTPLHDLMHRYRIQPHNIKTIYIVHFETRWKPDITIEVILETNVMFHKCLTPKFITIRSYM